MRAFADEPRLVVRAVHLGEAATLWPEVARFGNVSSAIAGSGAGLTPDEALVPALAEALERYAMSVFRKEQFILASAGELGKDALDLDNLPRCSATELEHSHCPLRRPDKTAPIRWVRGVSCITGRVTCLPVVMVYGYAGFASAGERFWIVNSTGCAAHASYERAILGGILECAERDAISLVWLQKLALPELEIDSYPEPLNQYWQRYQASSEDLQYRFFDATTDLGIPAVYGLQLARHNTRVATLVACAAADSLTNAVAKVMRDMVSGRMAFREKKEIPASWDEFTDVLHGATFMARAENAPAFDFLTRQTPSTRLGASTPAEWADDPLRGVLRSLERKGHDVFAVDLSTDEAIRVGIRVVRVIIPALQPLSFRYRARLLDNPRLYALPRFFGQRALPEPEINPWPQPFA